MLTLAPGTLAPGLVCRTVALLGTLGVLAGVAACGGGDAPTSIAPSGDPSRAGGSATLLWPLTGEPVDGDLPQHPVLAVKIDNSESSAPQIGLAGADLVTEELVEGGITRLNAMFYSHLPDLVGPVRSMRTSDIGIVKPAGAVLVASGGAYKTRGFINGANITTFTEGAPGYERASDRTAPYDLMMRLPDLAATLDDSDPPAPYLPFGANDMAGGKPAGTFEVRFSGGHTTRFSYQAGTGYTRPGSFAQSGDDFVADTVLVLRVQEGDAGYVDPAGNPVPETIYQGSGPLMLFHAGKVVAGSWSKDEPRSALRLSTKSGDPMTVPPGNVWIELAPVDADGGRLSIG